MKRLVLTLVLFAVFLPIAPAHADWRWKTPHFKLKKIKPVCSSHLCRQLARAEAKAVRRAHINFFNARRLAEWRKWTRLPIATCTWYGESGTGPRFAKYRYTLPNSTGSGAYGKYQLMPRTYSVNAKYGDWSPLDQEIAGHREYWKHGTQPWSNC